MNKTIILSLCLVLLLVVCFNTANGKKDRNEASRGNKLSSGRNKQGRRKVSKERRLNKRRKSNANTEKKKYKNKKRGQNKRKKGNFRLKTRKTNTKCSRQTDDTFCPAEKAQALNIFYNKMTNFFKQLKRSENFANIVKKKKAKKDSFTNDALILEDAVGGNLSAPSCSSNARQSSSAGEKGQQLKNCSNSISEACADITIDTTVSGDCNTKMKAFETKVNECKGSDSCTCWKDAFGMKSDLSSCDAKAEMDRVKGLKKSCTSKFGECKQAQDSAVELTATCPSSGSTTPSLTTAMTTVSSRRRLVIDFLANHVVVKRGA